MVLKILVLPPSSLFFPIIPSAMTWPNRIICLTSETTELVFALGAGDRIVGVSGYAVRPPEARQKEKVAAFTSIRIEKIRELGPDLILGFSDLQKQISHDLIAEGFNVFITNQRTIEEIGNVILGVGRLIGCEKKAKDLHKNFFRELEQLAKSFPSPCPLPRGEGKSEKSPRPEGERVRVRGNLDIEVGPKPRVYFEEWDEPMISGISWVSELIEKLGGVDVFHEKSKGTIASQRYVSSEEVIAANPDMIIASWCGKKVNIDKILSRPGWDQITAIHQKAIYEIKSSDILSPGLSLLHGARQMAEIFVRFTARKNNFN